MSDEHIDPATEIEKTIEQEKASTPLPEESIKAAMERADRLAKKIEISGKKHLSAKAFDKMVIIASELNSVHSDVGPFIPDGKIEFCTANLRAFVDSCKGILSKAAASDKDDPVSEEKGSATFFDWKKVRDMGFSRMTKLVEIDSEDKLKALLRCVKKKTDSRGVARDFLTNK